MWNQDLVKSSGQTVALQKIIYGKKFPHSLNGPTAEFPSMYSVKLFSANLKLLILYINDKCVAKIFLIIIIIKKEIETKNKWILTVNKIKIYLKVSKLGATT